MPSDAETMNVDDDIDNISLASTAESDQQEEYEVETILTELEFDDGVKYLVKWENYPIERSTWEPRESFCDEQTLIDWRRKKQAIAEGKLEEFDLAAWEDRVEALEIAREERKRRRREKRKRLGLQENPSKNESRNAGSTQTSRQSTTSHLNALSRPQLQRNTPSQHSSIHSVSHSRSILPQGRGKTLARKTSSFFGISRITPSLRSTSQKRSNSGDLDSSGSAKRLYTLSVRRRREKAKSYEPPPDMSQLDLRRPSDWLSAPTNPLELTRAPGIAPRHEPSGEIGAPSGNDPVAAQADSRKSAVHSSVDTKTRTDIPRPGNEWINTNAPLHESRSRRPPSPIMDITGRKKRYISKGSILVTVYYGPDKKRVGQALICAVSSHIRSKLLANSLGKWSEIEIWFRRLCTLDDYEALCYDKENVKFSNGYFEGYKDTEPNLNRMAEDLQRRGLVGIHYPKHESQDVLLAYPANSEIFAFLNQDFDFPRKRVSLFLAARSELQPYEKLPSLLQRMLATRTPWGDSVSTAERKASAVKTLQPLEIPVETVPSPVAQEQGNERLVIAERAARHQTQPTPVTAMGTEFDLDVFFKKQFSITFNQLAAVNGDQAVAKAFYLMFPFDEGSRAEGDLVIEFLKKHGAIVFSDRISEDWERFVGLDNPGVILFSADFTNYHSIQSLRDVLHKSFSLWTWSLSKPLMYFHCPSHFQRIFPHGGVILITEDFMTNDPDGTLIILSWFYNMNRKKFPGSWKLMLRPDVLNWLIEQHDNEDGKTDGYWLAMYQLIMKLNTTGHTSHVLDDGKDLDQLHDPLARDIAMSPVKLPGYGSCAAHESSGVKGLKDADVLAEFFAGWALVNCHRFRRFIIVTYERPSQRWEAWNHVEVKSGQEFFSQFKVDYKAIWKDLRGHGTSPSSATSTGEERSKQQQQQPERQSQSRRQSSTSNAPSPNSGSLGGTSQSRVRDSYRPSSPNSGSGSVNSPGVDSYRPSYSNSDPLGGMSQQRPHPSWNPYRPYSSRPGSSAEGRSKERQQSAPTHYHPSRPLPPRPSAQFKFPSHAKPRYSNSYYQ